MNFLSHYYFDHTTTNCYHVLGTVLPDLLKNADKNIVLHPEKHQQIQRDIQSITYGWEKHLEVDRYFHSSEFFKTHSHQLKLLLRPAIEGSPVKPFFLGHVALELILDNLLLTTGKVIADDFYAHLGSCDDEIIRAFLFSNGMKNPEAFIRFYDDFKRSRYLHSYAETEQVAYALKRICMRIWTNPFTRDQETAMNIIIRHYRQQLEDNFLSIFDEIDSMLKN
ncbi:DUF479 domain-containing protein [Mucilaginibacter robiniae]|uniref:DUF479 domain-containing protein n=1 Tax=Mucilaginibacter robiniae TaxID=2728022 RepID=A0A7L5E559_9SPHI|nr:ACP phosphodiesterase [Mucilaginibacter robiniae]QJD97517.1 DUF479 domain-containing protein [Mucilaginibacter robiniae]